MHVQPILLTSCTTYGRSDLPPAHPNQSMRFMHVAIIPRNIVEREVDRTRAARSVSKSAVFVKWHCVPNSTAVGAGGSPILLHRYGKAHRIGGAARGRYGAVPLHQTPRGVGARRKIASMMPSSSNWLNLHALWLHCTAHERLHATAVTAAD